jgi:hypothetical protein
MTTTAAALDLVAGRYFADTNFLKNHAHVAIALHHKLYEKLSQGDEDLIFLKIIINIKL